MSPEIFSAQKTSVEKESSKDVHSFLPLRSRPSFSTAIYKKDFDKDKRNKLRESSELTKI